jgi:hypothetical protein
MRAALLESGLVGLGVKQDGRIRSTLETQRRKRVCKGLLGVRSCGEEFDRRD